MSFHKQFDCEVLKPDSKISFIKHKQTSWKYNVNYEDSNFQKWKKGVPIFTTSVPIDILNQGCPIRSPVLLCMRLIRESNVSLKYWVFNSFFFMLEFYYTFIENTDSRRCKNKYICEWMHSTFSFTIHKIDYTDQIKHNINLCVSKLGMK